MTASSPACDRRQRGRSRRCRARPSSRRPTGKAATDNITVQIVRIDAVAGRTGQRSPRHRRSELPLPPLLEPRMVFDGYRIVREIHGSSRSHIYLGVDVETDAPVAIKIPSIDLRDDPAYLKRFLMEEWIARRIDSPHVLKPCSQSRTAQLPLCRDRIHRWADADAMDDRPSETRPRNGARHRRADRQGAARLPPHGNAASGPAGPTTS